MLGQVVQERRLTVVYLLTAQAMPDEIPAGFGALPPQLWSPANRITG